MNNTSGQDNKTREEIIPTEAKPTSTRVTLEYQLIFLTGIFFILLFYAMYLTREIILPLVFAILFSFLLAPAVRFLQKMYIPAMIGAAITLLLVLSLLGYGCYALTQPAATWLNKGPTAINKVDLKLANLADLVSRPIISISKLDEEISAFMQRVQIEKSHVQSVKEPPLMGAFSTVVTTTGKFLIEFGVFFLLLYFLLISDDFLLRKFVNLAPNIERKKEVVVIAREVQHQVFRYLFARTAINVGLAIVVTILMFIMGMPDPALWGVIAGILEFIPYIGAIIGIFIIALVALFSFASIAYAFLVTFLFSILLFIEGNIVTPIVIGRAVTFSPVVVFISLMFWGWLWGVAGAFIAIPMMMTLKIIFNTLYETSFVSILLSE